jgi:group I intron endonuclease
MYGYVYKIENILNGKVYIGQTTQPTTKRKNKHFNKLEHNQHHNPHLQNSFNKHGKSVFYFQVINYATSKEVLDELEIGYINKYDCLNPKKGYNLKSGGSNGKPSEETCKKISENNPRYWLGKHLSYETRKKISESRKGKCKGKDNYLFGKKLSEKQRKLRGKHNIGNKYRFRKQRGKYRGTSYNKKDRNPWLRVWCCAMRYNKSVFTLGYFNDPISSEIVYDIVFKEVYG